MILKNKLGIENQVELNKVEEKISKQKAKQLFDTAKLIIYLSALLLVFAKSTLLYLRKFMILQVKCET